MIDGMLHVFEAASGNVLWRYNTLRDFDTVNGVVGKGGSLDSAPYVAANGTLFVVSGYSCFGQAPGKVLLAFRPKPIEKPAKVVNMQRVADSRPFALSTYTLS